MYPVYEISQTFGKVAFHVGFAELAVRIDRSLYLKRPFVRQELFISEFGFVECRGEWKFGTSLPAANYSAHLCPCEPWMLIDPAEAIAAHDLCMECLTVLPKGGFSRL